MALPRTGCAGMARSQGAAVPEEQIIRAEGEEVEIRMDFHLGGGLS